MKLFLIFILSFIVLAEVLVPCCLWDDCCPAEKTAQPAGRQQEKSECSPFATCGTCTQAIVVGTTDVQVAFHAPTLIEHTALPVVLVLSSYSASLLQPPRLA